MRDKTNNILVIEDDRDVLEAIVSILEYSGYHPRGMSRFNEGVLRRQLQTGDLSLIILDVMLSGDDGRELAVRLKSSDETKNLPILMISAYPEIEASVRQAGADDFLQKPFDLDELTQKVERFVNDSP